MRSLTSAFGRLFLVIALLSVSSNALASGPWDGAWVRDSARSHGPDVVELSASADGTWEFFDGAERHPFVPDGRVHTQDSSRIDRRATMPDARTLLLVESMHGREYDVYSMMLSQDGKILTVGETRLEWSGHKNESSQAYTRSGTGTSFLDSWKEIPTTSATKPAPKAQTAPVVPNWVIWTGPDGTMTWYIPRTGEVLRGKADMVPRRLGGPLYDGDTFTWKQTAPDRLEFIAYVDGAPEEYAIETISTDGQTLTDVLWAAGHEDSKLVSVYRRLTKE